MVGAEQVRLLCLFVHIFARLLPLHTKCATIKQHQNFENVQLMQMSTFMNFRNRNTGKIKLTSILSVGGTV